MTSPRDVAITLLRNQIQDLPTDVQTKISKGEAVIDEALKRSPQTWVNKPTGGLNVFDLRQQIHPLVREYLVQLYMAAGFRNVFFVHDVIDGVTTFPNMICIYV